MKIDKLVVASHNAGKINEIKSLLAPFKIEVQSAADLHLSDVEEDIDNTDPLLLCPRADKTYDSRRHAVSEVDTDDHRVYRLKGQHSGR